MSAGPSLNGPCSGEHCITCADEGIEMTVIRADADRELALCADGEGRRHSVETALVAPVAPGDRLLVHAGTAIAAVPAGAALAGTPIATPHPPMEGQQA